MAPLAVIFGTPLNFEQQIPLYVVALEDIPLDLLEKGVMACLRGCKFFPRPAEIREPIRDKLQERRHAARRLETALSFAQRQGTV